ncbi:SDR family oxidoreductase [Mycolicibacter arupensis]|uniref:SDR family oxidoreductase n=1 Tax=Mycolicibacter arupensis TaxID=342002 RepID=UPI003B3BDA7E
MATASLSGCVVAITGGARGIGLATARAFVAAGAKVAIGDLDLALAEHAVGKLTSDVVALPLDVTSWQSFSEFINGAQAALGPLDVLVNNAGVMLTGEFLAEPPAITDAMIAVNLAGVLHGCKLAAAAFAERGRGSIVNVASMAGTAGFPGVATYCATKFGVIGLTYALREELRTQGIAVSAVLPGIVHTELSSGLKLPGVVEKFVSTEPQNIAEAVLAVTRSGRALAHVPRRMKWVLRVASAMPERPRRFLGRVSRTERVYLAVDQAVRDEYHARAADRSGVERFELFD